MINIGDYEFKNCDLIERALTHSSFSNENYERLEFLGDSILDFIVAKYFFEKTSLNEGLLTKMRSHFVSEDNLCKVFDNLKLGSYVKLGKSCKELTKSIKCDMFESVIASIYLDSNLQTCENFIINNIFLEDYTSVELLDSKSKLQEIAQRNKQVVEYTLLEQKGLSHKPTFVVKASVGGISAIAESGSKQIAEQLAAKEILDIISKEKN